RKERRITDVVVGWSGAAPGPRWRFGAQLGALVVQGDANVLVARRVRPLTVTDRAVVLLPPRVDDDPEVGRAVRVSERPARNMGARMVIVTERLGADWVATSVQRVRPRVPTEPWHLEDWAHLPQLLADRLEPSDMVVVYGVRDGRPAWRDDLRAL